VKDIRDGIAVVDLRRLMLDLKQHQPNTSVRVRLIGEMWFANFMRIIVVTESGMVLNDEGSNKVFAIADLSSIVQFEIDRHFVNYSPHFQYDVILE
jgi:hypothetical protein